MRTAARRRDRHSERRRSADAQTFKAGLPSASSEGSHAFSGALVAMESRGVSCPVATPEGGPIAIAIPVPAHGQRQANAGGGRQGHRRRMRDAQQLGRDDVREKKRRERSPMSSKNPARREVGASDSREPRTLYAAQAVMWQETGMVGGPPCRCCGVVGTVDDPIVSPCSICELCGVDSATVFASGRYCSKRCAAKQRYARAGDPPIPVAEAGPSGRNNKLCVGWPGEPLCDRRRAFRATAAGPLRWCGGCAPIGCYTQQRRIRAKAPGNNGHGVRRTPHPVWRDAGLAAAVLQDTQWRETERDPST